MFRRSATDEDKNRLLAVQAHLGLSERDEFWPIVLSLDHYSQTIAAGRAASLREIKVILNELKEVPEKVGPIASAEAQRAIARIIEDASTKIAKASAEKSITTTDRISQRQWVLAMIAGGLIATIISIGSGLAVYTTLKWRGICAEEPILMSDGLTACVVAR